MTYFKTEDLAGRRKYGSFRQWDFTEIVMKRHSSSSPGQLVLEGPRGSVQALGRWWNAASSIHPDVIKQLTAASCAFPSWSPLSVLWLAAWVQQGAACSLAPVDTAWRHGLQGSSMAEYCSVSLRVSGHHREPLNTVPLKHWAAIRMDCILGGKQLTHDPTHSWLLHSLFRGQSQSSNFSQRWFHPETKHVYSTNAESASSAHWRLGSSWSVSLSVIFQEPVCWDFPLTGFPLISNNIFQECLLSFIQPLSYCVSWGPSPKGKLRSSGSKGSLIVCWFYFLTTTTSWIWLKSSPFNINLEKI